MERLWHSRSRPGFITSPSALFTYEPPNELIRVFLSCWCRSILCRSQFCCISRHSLSCIVRPLQREPHHTNLDPFVRRSRFFCADELAWLYPGSPGKSEGNLAKAQTYYSKKLPRVEQAFEPVLDHADAIAASTTPSSARIGAPLARGLARRSFWI